MLNASCFVTLRGKTWATSERESAAKVGGTAQPHTLESLPRVPIIDSDPGSSNITHKDTTISICSCRIPWQIRTFWLKDLDVIDVKECFAFQRLFGARIGDIEGTAVRGRFCDVSCRGNCPILGLDITWKNSHLVDHIPNGWVMFNGDI